MGCVTGTGAFQQNILPPFFLNLGMGAFATCFFIYFTEPANAGCQTGALMRFVHGFFTGAKQEVSFLQGHGRQWRQPGTQTAGTPGLGIDTAILHHWQSSSATKSLRMRQEGWGK